MRKTLEVFRFELEYQLRRPSTLVYFLILIGLGAMAMKMMSDGPTQDGTWFNAPFPVMMAASLGSMMALLFITGVAADSATRDADVRMQAIFYTSPVGRGSYLIGRFLGAVTVSALLVLALQIGSLIATRLPWVDPESLLPFRASAYLRPYLLLALPNAVMATAILFGLATLTRRAIASYAGAAFLFFFAMICGKVLAPRLGWSVAKLLDPLGYTTVIDILQSTNSIQKNSFVLALDAPLLANRLLWLGVGLAVMAAAYARFRFAHEAVGGERARSTFEQSGGGDVEPARRTAPAARRVFGTSTRFRQLLAIGSRSFHELHSSRVWWIVPLLAFLFIQAAPELAKSELGVPGSLTTARLLAFLTGDVSLFLTLLIVLSAGELVWRERGARIHSFADVTPVPVWIAAAGKFLGLAAMLVATLVVFMLAGLAVQTIVGTHSYDLHLYIRILFGLQLPEYLLTAALAMVAHVVVNQKYVATVLVVLTRFSKDLLGAFGIENNLVLYGDLPAWIWSEISGFGPGLEARLWFTVYFGGWALLFACATYLFWIRGEDHQLRQRIMIARRRMSGATVTLGAIAVAIIAGVGGFIFYHTETLDHVRTTSEIDGRSAEFERRYGQYASLPQPTLAATMLHVDFHPRRLAATLRGSHRFENRTGRKVETIHVVTPGNVESTIVSFDRAARATLTDDDLGYRIYALERAMDPGESIRMHFAVEVETGIFRKYGKPPVARNGSILIHRPRDGDHWLPLVGYQPARELDDPALRKKFGLRERSPYPLLGDRPVGNEQKGYEKIELETIVGTDADQVGVAIGEMRRTWIEKGRRYVHYVADAPVSNAYTILSANYAVHRSKWVPSGGSDQTVDIEIFHHPSHTSNLERMAHGVRASLDYYTREFGPYPHRQIRLVEYASHPYWLQMTAHSGLITYAEGFSLVRPEDDPREIDFPFAVITHEIAHQWWGHQLVPALVEGAPFLAESLSWYSGMLVVEETFGREHLNRLLAVMRANYMAPNQPRAFPLLRTINQLDAYRTGPFAMYALREAVGAEPVNRALRTLLAKFPPDSQTYPTTLDFYAELRASTPTSAHGLLKDLFEEITFWDLRATKVDVVESGDKAFRLTLHVEAQKLKGDGTGNEREVPMYDPVEVAVYDADGRSIYVARHRVRSGAQTIEIVVPRPPARAVIDPDHELLDRKPDDNEVTVDGGQASRGS